jgi:hypothetical protein
MRIVEYPSKECKIDETNAPIDTFADGTIAFFSGLDVIFGGNRSGNGLVHGGMMFVG